MNEWPDTTDGDYIASQQILVHFDGTLPMIMSMTTYFITTLFGKYLLNRVFLKLPLDVLIECCLAFVHGNKLIIGNIYYIAFYVDIVRSFVAILNNFFSLAVTTTKLLL